jgi:hypothetical protein
MICQSAWTRDIGTSHAYCIRNAARSSNSDVADDVGSTTILESPLGTHTDVGKAGGDSASRDKVVPQEYPCTFFWK